MSDQTIHTHEQDGRRQPGHKPQPRDEADSCTICVCDDAFGGIPSSVSDYEWVKFKLCGGRTATATITVDPGLFFPHVL